VTGEELAGLIRSLVGVPLRTRTGLRFHVLDADERAVLYEISGVPRGGRLDSYVRAVEYRQGGGSLADPLDLQALDRSNRMAVYEWAVLKQLGLLDSSE
jgi:hypothetical protein